MWSFGMLLYELITNGDDPFKNFSDEDFIKNLVSGDYKLPCPVKDLKTFYDKVLTKCWNKTALLRPTFQELDAILFSYFDSCEPDYEFGEASCDENKQLLPGRLGEIEEQNPDQINLSMLIKSRLNSETWIGTFEYTLKYAQKYSYYLSKSV